MTRSLTTPDRVVLLLSLVPYLLEHGPTALVELARAFDVEERLLRQLIPFLGMAGVPGETRTYQHEDLFDLDWDAYETYDIVSLTRVVAVDDTPRFSTLEAATLIAGLQSLRPHLPAALQAVADQASAKLAAVGPALPASPPLSVTPEVESTAHARITQAMNDSKRLSFSYRDTQDQVTVRRVEPLLLVQRHGEWYLRAMCLDRAAERTFAVDRMRDVRVLPEAATVRADAAAVVPDFEFARGELTAQLRVRVGALHRLAGFAPHVVGAAEDGWVHAEAQLAHPGIAVRLVQTVPGEVIVVGPEPARAAVRDWVDRVLAAHDE